MAEQTLLAAAVVVALLRSGPVRAAYGHRAGGVHDRYVGLLARRGLHPRESTIALCQGLVDAQELGIGDVAAARQAVGEEFARHCAGGPDAERAGRETGLVELGRTEAVAVLEAVCTFLEFCEVFGTS